jgi:hypothetical protein
MMILFCLYFVIVSYTATITAFRVGLYPYIPDTYNNSNENYLQRIDNDFSKIHPNANLVADFPDDPYNVSEVIAALESGKYDIMELDGLLLGAVAPHIQPWEDLCILYEYFIF